MDFDPLLDGLKGEDRAARERLLERLAGEGYSLEDLKAAVEEDRLASSADATPPRNSRSGPAFRRPRC